MNNPQKNKLSMFLAVLGVMETYAGSWTTLPGIQSMVTRLGDLTADIQTKSGIQGTPRTGITRGKSRKQVEMINLTVAVAGDLHSYAVAQADDTLAGQTDLEHSDLVQLADNLVGPRCRTIHDLAKANAAALASFGTTAADLTELDSAIKAYEDVATAPRQSTAVNTSVTVDIARDVQAAVDLLNRELDKAMAKFRLKSPDFYQSYKDARIIVDLGVNHHPLPGGGTGPIPAPPKP